MRFLSISEDSLMPSPREIVDESTMPVYRLANGCFAEVFPASPIAKQGSDSAPRTSAIYGLNVHEHCGSYDPRSQSLRTCQGSLLLMEADSSTEFLATFPRAGMIVSGKLYRLSMSGPTMSAKEHGLLPTLTVTGNYNRKGLSKKSGDGLATALKKLYPTLTAHDFRGGCKPDRTERMRQSSQRGVDLPTALRKDFPESTGIINPSWADGYMGYPIDWTDLKASVTPLSLKSPR